MRQPVTILAVAVALLVGGTGLTAYGLLAQAEPPRLTTVSPDAPVPRPDMSAAASFLPYAEPTGLVIPALGLDEELISVGQNPDGSIEVPAGEQYDQAAWYRHSPAPGQAGPAVIVGHVDSVSAGPSVFFRLGDMRPGDSVEITRADGRKVVYEVTAVRQYDRDSFPSQAVYVGSGSTPELRLITCGGAFSPTSGTYQANIVVFATLR